MKQMEWTITSKKKNILIMKADNTSKNSEAAFNLMELSVVLSKADEHVWLKANG